MGYGIHRDGRRPGASSLRHYTEGSIPADVLAPYHRQWLEHAVLLLEFELLAGKNGH